MFYGCLCLITKRSEQQARQIFNKWASKLPTNLVELFPEQLPNCLDTVWESPSQGGPAARGSVFPSPLVRGLHQGLGFPYSAPPRLAGLRCTSPFLQDSAPARPQTRLCASGPAPTLRPLLPFLSSAALATTVSSAETDFRALYLGLS